MSDHRMGPLDPRRDVVERLGFLASMYGMGEKIAFGTDQQTALDAITRIEALEAEVERLRDKLRQRNTELSGNEEYKTEVERLREAIAQFVYANDTEVSDDRPITPEEWEADWETAMSGLRAALAGEGGKDE